MNTDLGHTGAHYKAFSLDGFPQAPTHSKPGEGGEQTDNRDRNVSETERRSAAPLLTLPYCLLLKP